VVVQVVILELVVVVVQVEVLQVQQAVEAQELLDKVMLGEQEQV
jgi:hypothetical protein